MTELESQWMVRTDLSGYVNGLVLEPEEKTTFFQGRHSCVMGSADCLHTKWESIWILIGVATRIIPSSATGLNCLDAGGFLSFYKSIRQESESNDN